MGRVYTVPRSAKGESRILYIFTIKSFVVTIIFAILGIMVWASIGTIIELSLYVKIIITACFGALGYALSALKIPDTPMMRPLQKAGGEILGEILIRLLFFKRHKKIYLYNKDRSDYIIKRKEGNNK